MDLAEKTGGETGGRVETEHLQEMAFILEEESGAYENLVAWAARKRDALREGNLKALEEAIREEQVIVWRVSRLEKRRLTLEEEMAAAETGRGEAVPPGKERVLRFWIGRAPETIARRLEMVRVKLLRQAEALRRLNEINALLVKQGMAYLDFTFEALRGNGGAGLYCPTGELKKAVGESHFSRRI